MDKFDKFIENLNDLIADQPAKSTDWQVGYWAAIHAIRNAAHTAKAAIDPDDPCDSGHFFVPHVQGWVVCTRCRAEVERYTPSGGSEHE